MTALLPGGAGEAFERWAHDGETIEGFSQAPTRLAFLASYAEGHAARTAPRHDCGEACACDKQGVDPKLFELEARHERLLAAARAVVEHHETSGSADNCLLCGRYRDIHFPDCPLDALRAAVAECEADR